MAAEKKLTLKEELDSIPFKNREIAMMRKLQEEKAKSKQQVGRKKTTASASRGISLQGLSGLNSALGKQKLNPSNI
jgi:hypothetical protein